MRPHLVPLLAVTTIAGCRREGEPRARAAEPAVALPAPSTSSSVSLESTLSRRRSIRSFAEGAPEQAQIGQLLWAAQGVSDQETGHRTAPSAGALFPLTVYVARADGVFRYLPEQHALERVAQTDARPAIAKAALDQEVVRDAPVVFALAAAIGRTRAKYGDRAERYAAMEAGHAAQNLLLQATALGLGATPVGAFRDDALRAALRLPSEETPLYLVPVGRPR